MTSKLRVPFGLIGARLSEPWQVPNGNACGCICPACKRALVAKQKAQTPHFAHAPGEACEHGLETAIHLAAKQIISDRMEIRISKIKFISPYADGQSKTVKFEKVVPLDDVVLEAWLVDMRPGIIVRFGDEICIVEIAVTHFTDQVKKEKIRRRGIAAFEIDLNSIKEAFTFESLTRLLFLAPYPATWLYNKLIEDIAAKDEEVYSIAVKAKEALKRSNLAASQARELSESQRQADKFQKYRALPAQAKLEKNIQVLKISLPQMQLFSAWVPWDDSFGVDRIVWQSTVLLFIAKKVGGTKHHYFSPRSFNAEVCLAQLRYCFEITAKIKDGDSIAIYKYLKHLEDMGILNCCGRKEFQLIVLPEKWRLLEPRNVLTG